LTSPGRSRDKCGTNAGWKFQASWSSYRPNCLTGDFGANGYTTLAQADLIAERLRLRDGGPLLDVGSGQGWPGLYLAKVRRCSVVLTDLPEEGLRTARRRAAAEGIGERARR
jgi:2-polyprenyl-3-methyl-5-hydroxy-6-metoxy-1,4-benzoquinol methylase